MEKIKNHSQEENKILWLSNLIQQRIEKNPKFSLRAFANKVDISPTLISRILSGKRSLTLSMAQKISKSLALSPSECDEMQTLFSHHDATSLDIAQKELTMECFTAIKDWYHYGITQLLNLDGFVEDYKFISNMLSISEIEAKLAVNRLLNLGILDREKESGKLFRTSSHFTTTTDVASSGLRHFQRQILEKAILSLENDPLDERDITSITIAIDESKMKEAKQEIKKFRLRMSEFLGSGERTRVYNLGIHLIPLSKKINNFLSNVGVENEINH